MANRTPLNFFDAGSVNAHRYRVDVFEAYVWLFRVSVGPDFMYMDDNSKIHVANIVEDFLEEGDIRRKNWSSMSPELNLIKHVCDGLRRIIEQRNPSFRIRQELKAAILKE